MQTNRIQRRAASFGLALALLTGAAACSESETSEDPLLNDGGVETPDTDAPVDEAPVEEAPEEDLGE